MRLKKLQIKLFWFVFRLAIKWLNWSTERDFKKLDKQWKIFYNHYLDK